MDIISDYEFLDDKNFDRFFFEFIDICKLQIVGHHDEYHYDSFDVVWVPFFQHIFQSITSLPKISSQLKTNNKRCVYLKTATRK